MNSSVYVFGNFLSGYTQYPDEDFSASIFQTFYKRAKATTQVAVHRDGHLMYYCYIRKLQQKQYIGLCVLLNGTMLARFSGLFDLFENTIATLAENGHLIQYDKYGNLIANADKLFMNIEEVEGICKSLKKGFDNLANTAVKLPPENFSVGKNNVQEFVVDDKEEAILQSSFTNGYTFIYKSKGFNTAQMNSYKGVLEQVSKEVCSLQNEINILYKEKQKLQDENGKILRQKKQFQYVIILFIAIVACGVGILLLNKNLHLVQGQLADANDSVRVKNQVIRSNDSLIVQKSDTISRLNRTIESLSRNISALNSDLIEERAKNGKAESELEDFRNQISVLNLALVDEQVQTKKAENELENFRNQISSLPILVTSVDVANTDGKRNIVDDSGSKIYSSNTMFLSPKITYVGICDSRTVTLYFKLYTPTGSLSTNDSSPSGYSFARSISVSRGSENTSYLIGWGGKTKGFWSKGTYRWEVWYGTVCLKTKIFTIY